MIDYHPPKEPWLEILHKDRDIMVVNKPTGLLSVPGRGAEYEDSVLWRVQQEGFPRAAAAHRLDMATSGVIVIPLNPNAHRELSRQFRERETDKHYLAWVWGEMSEESGQVDLPLGVDWPNRPKQKVDFAEGRHALTLWQKLKVDNGCTLVKLTPITGRSHQLRVHMLELGHPILGDNLYAHPQALAAAPHLYLHAAKLAFTHPRSGERVAFEAAPPFAL
ncbi:MAG: pseudouridine synthase [Aeromonas sp.]